MRDAIISASLMGLMMSSCSGPTPAAEFYAGAGAGYGTTNDYVAKVFDSNVSGWVKQDSPVYQAFAGVRAGHLGIEGGFLELPRYQSEVHVKDYSAYRHIVAPITTADATQTITAHALYARANVYGPDWWLTPYAFAGAARVTTHNHEHAVYDHTIQNDFDRSFSKWAGYYGAGVMHSWGAVALRAELGVVPGASDTYWTGHRSAAFGTLGLLYRF